MENMDYNSFLNKKLHEGADSGFKPSFMPDILFDFQKDITEWAVKKGRDAIFSDCGTGKTPMQLTWAENVTRHTNKPVLILTPLAVSAQTIREGEKFNIECKRSSDGKINSKIVITNYERLHYFDYKDFAGCVCDESSILKSFDGARKKEITDFMRKVPYRLLATATAAPNDYIELGTSSEALGYLGYMDMLNKFFRNDRQNSATRRMYGEAPEWRLKGHAEIPFWRWVTSWARACRYPSDLGYKNDGFILPELIENRHLLRDIRPPDGMLFNIPANTLPEQRKEKRRTIKERCEKVLFLVSKIKGPVIIWCHLNDEGYTLERMIPGAVQVSGSNKDEIKEERFMGFTDGKIRILITKPRIGAWGLNWQHCSNIIYFPSHSYEQYYQAVRRCWRFGQKKKVTVDIVLTEGEQSIMDNLSRKSEAANKMFENLIAEMNHSMSLKKKNDATLKERVPAWL